MKPTASSVVIKRPILRKRAASARGQTETGWLHSRHTFSFGEYVDPDHMGFRSLRVINDDIIEPGGGFGTHAHRNAEIFSYVIEGELEHKDSMGNGRVIKAGDLQYMSAGKGVQHSEFNPSKSRRAHFLQIWLEPNQPGGEPRYAEKSLGKAARSNSLTLLFADEPRDEAIGIRTDAELYFGKLDAGRSVTMTLSHDQGVWIHLIRGELNVMHETLQEGDGAAIMDANELAIAAKQDSEFLTFVLA